MCMWLAWTINLKTSPTSVYLSCVPNLAPALIKLTVYSALSLDRLFKPDCGVCFWGYKVKDQSHFRL